MSVPVCRGCAGTGISIKATPREVQAAELTIVLIRSPAVPERASASRTLRVTSDWAAFDGEPWMRGRLAFAGPLLFVLREYDNLAEDGWEVAGGSLEPDRSLLCGWCGGMGRGLLLTAHAMQEALDATAQA